MADDLKQIMDYPDVSFIEWYTQEKLLDDMTTWYMDKYEEENGKRPILAKGDERRLELQACAYYIFHGYELTDLAGKMNLLKYSRADFLEDLGALKHVSRLPATGAHTTIRFSLQEKRTSATGIPAGTRVTAGNNLYFQTDEYAEIPAGNMYADVGATCMTTGAAGNYLGIGEINILVDPVPFIGSVSNVTVPENGSDEEDDDSLKVRIYKAPSEYSSAGTRDAYEFFVLSFNPAISDIKVTSPEPRIAKIQYLLEDGRIPEKESLSAMKEYLEQTDIKAMTDVIEVEAPEKAEYAIKMKYFINQSDQANAGNIQEKINQSIEDYKKWQSEKIGRDINPDKLRQLVLAAGAKRTEITSPVYAAVKETAVAVLTSADCSYGGLEDD